MIKEQKEGFSVGNILSEDFLSNAAFFQKLLTPMNKISSEKTVSDSKLYIFFE